LIARSDQAARTRDVMRQHLMPVAWRRHERRARVRPEGHPRTIPFRRQAV